MDEKVFDAILNALGTMIQGEIVITKKRGEDVAEVKTDMHPFLALSQMLQAIAIMLRNAAHTGDELQLDLSEKNLAELAPDLGNLIFEWVKSLEE